jgi:hypothetical protein
MATTFVVPKEYEGLTLSQIAQKKGGYVPRLDLFASQAGISQETPLTAGQKIDFPTSSGGEYGWGASVFTTPEAYSKQESEAFAAKQKGEEEAFMAALNEKVAGQEKLGTAAERIGGELQLPALRQSAFDLTQTLKGIPQTQETISKQVGISAPNLQKRIASEQGRIAPLAQEAVSQQQFSEQELGTRLGYLVAEQAKELEPFYQAALPLLSDRLAREQTNYTQDKQNEFDLLLTKLNQGFQATQAELDRAQQLAIAESQYTQVKNSQSIETIGGRKVLVTYDNNGNIVSKVDLGSSSSGLSTMDGW